MNGLIFLRKFTFRLYNVRGMGRIADLVRKFYLPSQQHVIVNDFDGNLKFTCFLNSHISSLIFWQGSYSSDQLKLLDRILISNMTFIDIGANEGEQTIFAAKRLVGGKVISFEPTTNMYERLINNIQLNGFENVVAVKQGLGEQAATLPIFLNKSFGDGSVNEGLATLYAGHDLGQQLEIVKIGRLDDFVSQSKLDSVDVIKIDVEGAEKAVLQGAESTISQFHPIIILEVNEVTCRRAGYSAIALLEHLQKRGYRFEVILRGGKTRQIQPETLEPFQDIVCYPISYNQINSEIFDEIE